MLLGNHTRGFTGGKGFESGLAFLLLPQIENKEKEVRAGRVGKQQGSPT